MNLKSIRPIIIAITSMVLVVPFTLAQDTYEFSEVEVITSARPHDVAPDPNHERVWYTAQGAESLGLYIPSTGEVRHIYLGAGSASHGVIVGDDGMAWITDGGLNAIVRVDPETEVVDVFPLPSEFPNTNLNTATFDGDGILWFTGQNGIYGRFDPVTEEMNVFNAPRGRGPYGITTTPDGDVYYASLAGSHIAYIDRETYEATVIEPPTANQGARRVWSDSLGRIWVAEWNVGQLGLYDPETEDWQEWKLPGVNPLAYAVYVDERDGIWVSDFGSNSIWRFDLETETFLEFPLPIAGSQVRQMLGRDGEVWGAESSTDQLFVITLPELLDEE